MTQDISDINLALGHSLRTPAEAVQLARNDPQIGTSLLESRLMLGSSGGVRPIQQVDAGDGSEERAVRWRRLFIAERRKERLEYGETVYLLEPNVKRSRGGLRDIHLLRWLWYIKAAWPIRTDCTTWACCRSSTIAG